MRKFFATVATALALPAVALGAGGSIDQFEDGGSGGPRYSGSCQWYNEGHTQYFDPPIDVGTAWAYGRQCWSNGYWYYFNYWGSHIEGPYAD